MAPSSTDTQRLIELHANGSESAMKEATRIHSALDKGDDDIRREVSTSPQRSAAKRPRSSSSKQSRSSSSKRAKK